MTHAWAALGLLALGACGGSSPPAGGWFAARGQHATTWHACVRIGAALRAACDGDAACESRVTRELTRSCYAGRYAAATSDDPHTLSPCFWDRTEPPAASPAAYAEAECQHLELGPHCVAELREVIEGICLEGAMDLTGAGP
jgi:hypothetical protein